jgi:hypothetical protein
MTGNVGGSFLRNRCFRTSVFRQPPAFTFANAARNQR